MYTIIGLFPEYEIQEQMSGVKGRSGPRKSPSTIVNQALARCDKNFGDIFQVIIDRALGGDEKCAIYLIDRRLGKPHQSIDTKSVAVIVTADDYELASRLTRSTEALLLNEYGGIDALQGQGDTEELQSGQNEES